eukprot:10675605-Prorocentrum_lima.AAC.1
MHSSLVVLHLLGAHLKPYKDFFNCHRTSCWTTPNLASNDGGCTRRTPSSSGSKGAYRNAVLASSPPILHCLLVAVASNVLNSLLP